MAVIRLDRFTADPATTDELISRRNALVAAVRNATPGLLQARLTRVDDETWIDMWCWDTRAHVQAAVKQAILSLIVLDASVALVTGPPVWALVILSLLLPPLLLGRWVYST